MVRFTSVMVPAITIGRVLYMGSLDHTCSAILDSGADTRNYTQPETKDQ